MNILKAKSLIQQNLVILGPDMPVQVAIKAMARARQTCTLIVDAENYLIGIFTERDVTYAVAQKVDFAALTLADVMTDHPETVNLQGSADVFSLSRIFLQKQIRHLPVVDEQGRLKGLMTPQSMRNLVKPEYLLRQLLIADVMTVDLVQTEPQTSMLEVVAMMTDGRVSCVIVVDPLNTVPLGIITERDVVQLQADQANWSQVSAQDCMSQPLHTMHPQNSLWLVHENMMQMQVRRLVITHPTGELAGLITQTQLLRLMNPIEIHQTMQQMKSVINRQTSQLQQLNSQLKAANTSLDHQSKVDELTQIYNRRYFNHALAALVDEGAGHSNAISILLIDVDHFKKFNDTYGHLAGDRCLFKVAQVLNSMTQTPKDICARYGGEEFVLLLPGADAAEAEAIAQDMIERVEALAIAHAASTTSDAVTISVGVLSTICMVDNTPERMLQLVDEALYQAKDLGRNRYHATSSDLCVI